MRLVYLFASQWLFKTGRGDQFYMCLFFGALSIPLCIVRYAYTVHSLFLLRVVSPYQKYSVENILTARTCFIFFWHLSLSVNLSMVYSVYGKRVLSALCWHTLDQSVMFWSYRYWDVFIHWRLCCALSGCTIWLKWKCKLAGLLFFWFDYSCLIQFLPSSYHQGAT